MTISASPVNQTTATNASSLNPLVVTIPAPANGNTLVLTWGDSATTPTITSITQTGATWVSAAGPSVAIRQSGIWWAKNVSGAGTSVTINLSGSGSNTQSCIITEWSGISASATAVSPQTANGTGTAFQAGSTTPTASREALIIAAVRGSGIYSAGPTNSFTGMSAPDTRHRGAYLVVASTTGSYTTDWTAGSGQWDSAIVSFVNPAGVGNAPTAAITSQSGYTSYDQRSGASITFTGTGTDIEDGTLTGASLVWTSSLDGALGTGVSITTSSLSIGTHTITLTATDSNTNTGTATKTIVVKNAANWNLFKRNVSATALTGLGSFTFGMQVLVPANYSAGTTYPVMMEIGGSGQRGTDNTTQMTDGYAATVLATPSAYSSYGAIWIFPQYPTTGTYGGREWAYPMIAAALAAAQSEWSINTNKLHLTGFSLGGMIALEVLYNTSPLFATCHIGEGTITNREGLLSGNDPAGSWTDAQAAAEVAGRWVARSPTTKIRQYQDSADTNVTPVQAQIARDAFFAVDPGHVSYNYLTTTGLGHVPAYQAMQADTTNLDWAFGISLPSGVAGLYLRRRSRR